MGIGAAAAALLALSVNDGATTTATASFCISRRTAPTRAFTTLEPIRSSQRLH